MGEEAAVAEQPEDTRPTIVRWLSEGPSKLVSWLGNNEIQFGETVIETEEGKLRVAHDAVQPTTAAMVPTGMLDWWAAQPNLIKYGVPAAALLLLLRR
jgi:hypothetical protein